MDYSCCFLSSCFIVIFLPVKLLFLVKLSFSFFFLSQNSNLKYANERLEEVFKENERLKEECLSVSERLVPPDWLMKVT